MRGNGRRAGGVVEEFAAMLAFDGGVLDVFGAEGALFHGEQNQIMY